MQAIGRHAQILGHAAARGDAEQAVLSATVAMSRRTLVTVSARGDRFERDVRSARKRHAFADGINHAGHFVARLQSGDIAQYAAEDVQIAAADANSRNADAHPTRSRFGHFAVDDVQLSADLNKPLLSSAGSA